MKDKDKAKLLEAFNSQHTPLDLAFHMLADVLKKVHPLFSEIKEGRGPNRTEVALVCRELESLSQFVQTQCPEEKNLPNFLNRHIEFLKLSL